MFKNLASLSTRRSEAELSQFVHDFCEFTPPVDCIWAAAQLHISLSKEHKNFQKTLSSELGENCGDCAGWVLTSNRYVNKFHKNGKIHLVAGMKIWNSTFRSMSNPAFHHYGMQLWTEITLRYDEVKDLAKKKIETSTNEENTAYFKRVLTQAKYIPPQFR